ncbi:MAG: hypothetical protein C5B52_12780 [Bacteroidetes bacterium]|nr:MAG: hypothetical protein C5B52_12780 [Bacteroidota bacterium]
MKKTIICFLLMVFSTQLFAQRYQSDWDVYLMASGKKPVAIMVDLGVKPAAPMADRPNLIILHLFFRDTTSEGMPTNAEIKNLDNLEESFISPVESTLDAVYVGRYTKDGKRDFFFYTNDTVGYRKIFEEKLGSFAKYEWSALAKKDAKWSDYFDVLYPTPRELERIKNRRGVDKLKSEGDRLTESRKVEHWIFFKYPEDRKTYAALVQDVKFEVIGSTDEKGVDGYRYGLHISRIDKVDYNSIDKVSLYLWDLALKNRGRYDGWETDVVK